MFPMTPECGRLDNDPDEPDPVFAALLVCGLFLSLVALAIGGVP